MQNPFETHKVYITLNNDKMYQLFPDFTKKEVDKKEVLNKADVNSRSKPFMVIHNEQINCGKSYLLDKNKSTRNGAETALEYCKIGFLTKEEIKALLF